MIKNQILVQIKIAEIWVMLPFWNILGFTVSLKWKYRDEIKTIILRF